MKNQIIKTDIVFTDEVLFVIKEFQNEPDQLGFISDAEDFILEYVESDEIAAKTLNVIRGLRTIRYLLNKLTLPIGVDTEGGGL